MFRKIVETLVGGAIGLLALYTVAKVAYAAGCDAAEAEQARSVMKDSDGIKESEVCDKPKKIGFLSAVRGMAWGSRRVHVFQDIMNNPEQHKLEAYVDGGEVHIDIRKRSSCEYPLDHSRVPHSRWPHRHAPPTQ